MRDQIRPSINQSFYLCDERGTWENYCKYFQTFEQLSIFFDIEKVYDTARKYGILISIGVRSRQIQFIANFLNSRSIQVQVGNTLSPPYVVGVEFFKGVFSMYFAPSTASIRQFAFLIHSKYLPSSSITIHPFHILQHISPDSPLWQPSRTPSSYGILNNNYWTPPMKSRPNTNQFYHTIKTMCAASVTGLEIAKPSHCSVSGRHNNLHIALPSILNINTFKLTASI